jgi:hypothetical protein
MTDEPKVPYSARLSAEDQVDAEEMVAALVAKTDAKCGGDPNWPEMGYIDDETAQEAGRNILYAVLRKFRSDLFEDGPRPGPVLTADERELVRIALNLQCERSGNVDFRELAEKFA